MCKLNIDWNYRPVKLKSINAMMGDVLLSPYHYLQVGSEFRVFEWVLVIQWSYLFSLNRELSWLAQLSLALDSSILSLPACDNEKRTIAHSTTNTSVSFETGWKEWVSWDSPEMLSQRVLRNQNEELLLWRTHEFPRVILAPNLTSAVLAGLSMLGEQMGRVSCRTMGRGREDFWTERSWQMRTETKVSF